MALAESKKISYWHFVQLEGFCPWFLAVSGGGLLPGCELCETGGPGIGPGGDIGDGRRVYALSSPLAAQLFSAEPDR